MPRALLLIAALVAVALVGAGCENKEPAPAPKPAVEPAPAAAPDAAAVPAAPDAAAAAPAPDSGAAADTASAGADKAEPGLLPEPDFTLRGPSLKAPSLGKKGILGEEGAAAPDDKKPRLLDTELKKE